jgi:ribonuclease VapC
MVFVDASAFVAMLVQEPGCDRLFERIERGGVFVTSPMAIYEATLALARETIGGLNAAAQDLDDFMARGSIQTVAIDPDHARSALLAHGRFGKGQNNRAKLNMGDCFAYAVAKSRNASILFVGDDFNHTDLPDALAGV